MPRAPASEPLGLDTCHLMTSGDGPEGAIADRVAAQLPTIGPHEPRAEGSPGVRTAPPPADPVDRHVPNV